MPTVTARSIRRALSSVKDPELGLDVVKLGFIYTITVNRNSVTVLTTLTTPGCPLASRILRDIKEAIQRVASKRRVIVELTFDPPWTPDRIVRSATTNRTHRRTKKALYHGEQ